MESLKKILGAMSIIGVIRGARNIIGTVILTVGILLITIKIGVCGASESKPQELSGLCATATKVSDWFHEQLENGALSLLGLDGLKTQADKNKSHMDRVDVVPRD